MAQLLDERVVTLEVAYRISKLYGCDAEILVHYIQESKTKKPKCDIELLKKYAVKKMKPGHMPSYIGPGIKDVVIFPSPASIPVYRRSTDQDK